MSVVVDLTNMRVVYRDDDEEFEEVVLWTEEDEYKPRLPVLLYDKLMRGKDVARCWIGVDNTQYTHRINLMYMRDRYWKLLGVAILPVVDGDFAIRARVAGFLMDEYEWRW
jgi:enterochelin esterase-like enzyme